MSAPNVVLAVSPANSNCCSRVLRYWLICSQARSDRSSSSSSSCINSSSNATFLTIEFQHTPDSVHRLRVVVEHDPGGIHVVQGAGVGGAPVGRRVVDRHREGDLCPTCVPATAIAQGEIQADTGTCRLAKTIFVPLQRAARAAKRTQNDGQSSAARYDQVRAGRKRCPCRVRSRQLGILTGSGLTHCHAGARTGESGLHDYEAQATCLQRLSAQVRDTHSAVQKDRKVLQHKCVCTYTDQTNLAADGHARLPTSKPITATRTGFDERTQDSFLPQNPPGRLHGLSTSTNLLCSPGTTAARLSCTSQPPACPSSCTASSWPASSGSQGRAHATHRPRRWTISGSPERAPRTGEGGEGGENKYFKEAQGREGRTFPRPTESKTCCLFPRGARHSGGEGAGSGCRRLPPPPKGVLRPRSDCKFKFHDFTTTLSAGNARVVRPSKRLTTKHQNTRRHDDVWHARDHAPATHTHCEKPSRKKKKNEQSVPSTL